MPLGFDLIGGVILKSRGVIFERFLYRRGVELFAAHRGGFVRLMGNGRTSHDGTTWSDIDAPGLVIEPGYLGAPQIVREDDAMRPRRASRSPAHASTSQPSCSQGLDRANEPTRLLQSFRQRSLR